MHESGFPVNREGDCHHVRGPVGAQCCQRAEMPLGEEVGLSAAERID